MASSLFLQQAYLAYFGRPVDATAVISYANVSEATVIANFSSSAESKALYPTFGLAQINAIYQTLFGRDAELAGANYHLNTIANGTQTPASMALAILKGALNADITAVNNKLAASAAFTANLDTTAEALGYAGDASAASARAFLSTVTDKVVADAAAVSAAVVGAVNAGSPTATATAASAAAQVAATAVEQAYQVAAAAVTASVADSAAKATAAGLTDAVALKVASDAAAASAATAVSNNAAKQTALIAAGNALNAAIAAALPADVVTANGQKIIAQSQADATAALVTSTAATATASLAATVAAVAADAAAVTAATAATSALTASLTATTAATTVFAANVAAAAAFKTAAAATVGITDDAAAAASVNAAATSATAAGAAVKVVADAKSAVDKTATDAAAAKVVTDAAAAKAVVDAAAAKVIADAAAVAANKFSVGADAVKGTDAADTFMASVVQNTMGLQVNTLGSGDTIVGGAGIDTLSAKITAGAFVGSSVTAVGGVSASMPIQPETSGVELIKLQAVNAGIAGAGKTTEVFVSAKDMVDVTRIASNHSDANLTIQNLTTLDASGSMRNINTMTVAMEYTGNADSNWEESDMHVYFDQDYLNPSVTTTNTSIEFKILNEDGYDATINTGVLPLGGVTVGQMDIRLNGVTFKLAPFTSEVGDTKGIAIQTYAQLLTAVQTSLVALKAANPTNLSLQTVVATLGTTFTTDISPVTGLLRSGTSIVLTAAGMTGTTVNVLNVLSTDLQIVRATDPTALANNNRYERVALTPSTQGQELVINVALEKVGLAGDGGALVIGSMFKDGTNTYSDLYAAKGINEFRATVFGASDKPSSLSQLASTGNNLKTVIVTTDAAQTGTFASLTIGNSQTKESQTSAPLANAKTAAPTSLNEQALKDVRTFDASGMKADVTLFAGLSKEVTAKYLNVTDIAANAVTDNLIFAYSTGTGNDTINLYLDAANLAKPGTGTREDLTLTINTNDGNDTVVTMVGDGSTATTGVNSNWYANQHINANLKVANGVATGQLQINTGNGNDVVRTMGSGDFAINAGAGDDTVYADNTGSTASLTSSATAPINNAGRAIFTLNTAGDVVSNLQSRDAVVAQNGVVNLSVNVNFKGYTGIGVVALAGATVATSVTDLSINQAIKLAINSDPVLSKLLIAEDGPGRTLVVRDLIDGLQVAGDLKVSLVSTAKTAGQGLIAGLATLTDLQANALGFANATGLTNAATATGRFDTFLATDASAGAVSYAGKASSNTADNLIVGGAGNDVLVLGTGSISNDTIVYSGFSNGADSVVNFTSGAVSDTNAGDKIDFSGYGAKGVYVGASVFGATAAVGQTYLLLTETAGNAGFYTVTQYTEAGAVDTLVGTVGTIDFGSTQAFVLANFVL